MRVWIYHNSTWYKKENGEITDVRIINEIDPLSVNLISNSADVTLNITEDKANFAVSSELSISCEFQPGRTKVWAGYLKKAEKKGKNKWQLSIDGLVGHFDDIEFAGDVYTDKNVLELVTEICGKAGVGVNVYSTEINNDVISGWIPYTTCREALSQVLFAAGWYMRSIHPSSIQFARLSADTPKEIAKSRVLTGGVSQEEDKITGVEVLAHDFSEDDDGYVKRTYWKSPTKGEAFNVMVEHENPVYAYEYKPPNKKSTYKVITESANFLELNYSCWSIEANDPMHMRVEWIDYEHSTALFGKYDENSTSGLIYAIENKTMVTEQNVQSVLDRCFEYYTKNTEATAKIVIGKHVAEDGTVTYDDDVVCGDMVTIPTDHQGTYTGRVVKEQYNLNGNIIIKEITVK